MGFSSRMDCCGQFVKYSLFISNFVMFVSCIILTSKDLHLKMNVSNLVLKVGGAIVFSLTLWTLIDRSFVNELLGTNLFSGAVYVLLVTSVIICLVSFLGCVGAGKEVKCLLLSVSFKFTYIIFIYVLGNPPTEFSRSNSIQITILLQL